MHKVVVISIISFSLILLILSGVGSPPQLGTHPSSPSSSNVASDASVQTSIHVVIYSTSRGSQYDIFVPLNSSGFPVFPCWHIYMYGSGSFTFTVNDSVVASGVVVNSINISYDWNLEKGNRTLGVLDFDGTHYSFNDIISGPINDQVIESVFVSSTLRGQNQVLAAEPNNSGDLMYPTWKVQMESTQKLNYSIYLRGDEISHGIVIGSKNVTFNVSGSSVSVQVILGQHTYTYPNELISSVPIQQFYGPKPPADTATFLDEVFAAVKGVFGLFPAMVLSYIGVKPIVVARKERSPVVW